MFLQDEGKDLGGHNLQLPDVNVSNCHVSKDKDYARTNQ